MFPVQYIADHDKGECKKKLCSLSGTKMHMFSKPANFDTKNCTKRNKNVPPPPKKKNIYSGNWKLLGTRITFPYLKKYLQFFISKRLIFFSLHFIADPIPLARFLLRTQDFF